MTSSRPESGGDQKNSHSSETRTDTHRPTTTAYSWVPPLGDDVMLSSEPSGGHRAPLLWHHFQLFWIPDKLCTAELQTATGTSQGNELAKLLLLQIYNQSDKTCGVFRADDTRCRATSGPSVIGFVTMTSFQDGSRFTGFCSYNFNPDLCELYYNNTDLASSPSLIILQVPCVKRDEFTAQIVLREQASRTLQGCG